MSGQASAEHTIVAVYDTASHADAAVRALEAAGVSPGAIDRHAQGGTVAQGGAASAQPARHERGFWSSLFGGDTDDADVYGRSVAGGSTVVTARLPEGQVARASEILEAHDPIDIDERAAGYGATARGTTATAAPAASGTAAGDTIKVVEERLAVGKRVVNRGGARVRVYVVETPVEKQVTLRDETVQVERHPVNRPLTGADAETAFRERTVSAHEVDEEPVVAKQARVVEEIVVRKEADDRVETVRDTVRHTEVDVEDGTKTTGATGITGGAGGTTTPGRKA